MYNTNKMVKYTRTATDKNTINKRTKPMYTKQEQSTGGETTSLKVGKGSIKELKKTQGQGRQGKNDNTSNGQKYGCGQKTKVSTQYQPYDQ